MSTLSLGVARLRTQGRCWKASRSRLQTCTQQEQDRYQKPSDTTRHGTARRVSNQAIESLKIDTGSEGSQESRTHARRRGKPAGVHGQARRGGLWDCPWLGSERGEYCMSMPRAPG